ncbi:MAG: 3-hydroxyacyl-CoA dehydrogenase [Promethearchaeota archaeon]|nr:MAG: 3-hydroxyacyl-CoA dehydrogenase [Candidatus Lokiarchaeota archaeon]
MNAINRIENVSVIGTGTMGREIAQVVLMGGYNVSIYDKNQDAIEKAKEFIINNLKRLEKKNNLPKDLSIDVINNKLHIVDKLEKAVEQCDLLIEAIPEIMELKQELFKQISEICKEDTILASNTSNMPVTEIALKARNPERIIGMHFFTPIVVLTAIELIKGQKTSEKTMRIGESFAQSLPCLRGERYIIRIEKETPGFIVNRITGASSIYFSWLLQEAQKKGIPYERIDADVVAMQGGGLGPLAKYDILGLDVIYHSFKYYAENLSKDFIPPNILENLVNKGHLGKKTRKGFYEWTDEGKPKGDFSKKANLFDPELYMAIQLNEGCRLLEEGVVDSYKEIDKAIIAAMSMPGPFSAGKRHYEKWADILEKFAEESDLLYLKPCKMLKSGRFLEMK